LLYTGYEAEDGVRAAVLRGWAAHASGCYRQVREN